MYNAMKMLIKSHHYATAAQVIARLHSFKDRKQITEEQFIELYILTEAIYNEVVE